MKITQDVRDYAATLNDPAHQGLGAEGDQLPSSLNSVGLNINGTIEDGMATSATRHPEEARSAVSKDEAEKGMAQMSAKFKEMGSSVYLDAEKVKASNRVL